MEKILITTQDLDGLLEQSINLAILDCRPPMAYLFSHIPHAVNVSWKSFSDPDSSMKSLLDSDLTRLEKKVGALGISNDSRVVVYADPFECWGDEGRVYWMLSYLGHHSVQVLDGGWFKWKREGRRIERGTGKAKPAEFKARINPSILMTKEELGKRMNPFSPDRVIIDARTREEYLGLRSSNLPREGHIPGAINIPWDSFYNADGTVRSPAEIRKVLESNGVSGDKEAVTYCTGGVRSAWLYLVLKLSGIENAKNYSGSWMEWSQDANLPIER